MCLRCFLFLPFCQLEQAYLNHLSSEGPIKTEPQGPTHSVAGLGPRASAVRCVGSCLQFDQWTEKK